MIYIKILAGISVAVSAAWLISKPDYDSGLALVGGVSALITAFVVDRKRMSRVRQQQQVANSSMGIQAGGDVNVGSVSLDKNAK